MRKLLCVFLIAVTLLLVTGCKKEEEPVITKTTVMVYMIGSDLESKSGAGTDDLREMENSGVDLSRVNVLVYAGGSPTWHNELADPQQHTLLLLTENGFEPITATGSYSMGLAECLTTFLGYGYENFPADSYGLILWDHGNGPVIGYGKDMLFDNDSLTLKEMSQALADSPFRDDTKLDWVGFDACLMASAELASIWAPHANYLLASQEVEPSFGWNYDFLSQIGTCSTDQLMHFIADTYLNACLTYYENRGYEDRDTTLSCLDLSQIGDLEAAVNALFTKALSDVQTQYNQLTARRAYTRALGRASTGSEYDLVDLRDTAIWLGEMYPQEATALLEAIDKIVLANATSTPELCGISLYYPFHNKPYYEKAWSDAYTELGTYPAYQQYLKAYESIWLGSDKLDTASSAMPAEDNGLYTLQLTPEQKENLASAKYYILVRDGEEYYTRIFTSSDVENQDGLLTAGFDGNVLYVSDDFGNYHIPVAKEQDRVGDTGRYILPVALTNGAIDIPLPEDHELEIQTHRYYLNIHKDTGEVTVSALTPYDNTTEAELANGKKTDTELTQWTNAYFLHDSHLYLAKYDNGAIAPVDQWPADTVLTGVSYALENGLNFTYAPLVAGEYYLLFEMEDTQGNRYCSELLPIQTDGALPQYANTADPTVLNWTSGNSLFLTETNGVKIWLDKVENFTSEGYALKAENTNDFPVIVTATDLYWGEDLFLSDNFGYLEVPAGETVTADFGHDLGAISDIGLTEASGTIRFHLTLRHGITYAAIMYNQPFTLSLSESTMLKPDETTLTFNGFSQPVLDCLAKEQTLLENDQLRIYLLGLGSNGIDKTLRGALRIENLTDRPLVLDLEGFCLDAVYVPCSLWKLTIPANTHTYSLFAVESYTLSPTKLESASTIRMLMRQYVYNPLFSGNALSTLIWCDIKLDTAGQPGTPAQGSLLYDKDGIRVSLVQQKLEYGYSSQWYLAVTNSTDRDIALDLVNWVVDGDSTDRYVSGSDTGIPAGTTAFCEIRHSNYDTKIPAETFSFRLRIMDFKKEAILYTAAETITLYTPRETE